MSNQSTSNNSDYTVIDNIDLKPTGNTNEFTVEMSWTDADGVPQTTTDATPIQIDDAISPWDNPDATPADQSSLDIQYTEGNVGFGITPEYGAHVAHEYIYAKSFTATGGTSTAYIQRSNDGVGNFQEYWNTEGTASPVRLSNGPVYNREFSANSEWYQMRGAGTDVIGSAVNWTATHYFNMNTGQQWFGQYGQGTFDDAAPARVLGVSADGKVIEVDPETLGASCPEPMTRAELIALAGSYEKDCHYVVTDYTRGNVGAATIELHAVDADTLSMDVSVKTAFDAVAWAGRYDIDTNRLTFLADNLDNEVTGQNVVDTFPWGNTSVVDNRVLNATTLTYSAGVMQGNTFGPDSVSVINGSTFSENEIGAESNVNYSGTGVFGRNTVLHEANVTVSSGDFRENTVAQDATIISSTTGDVDNNSFGHLSNSTISGAANVDTCEVDTDGNIIVENANITSVKVGQEGNLTIRGGSLQDSTIEQDAQVVLYGGTHYENKWGTSVVFNQVSGTTAYVRYSSFDGTTTWTHGQVNLSNVESYVSTANTTGSTGTISNTEFTRAYMPNLQNIASLTITDSDISGYSQITANNAARLYIYRAEMSSGSRILLSAGATFNTSNSALSGYGYAQVLQGTLTMNSTTLSGGAYAQHNTAGTNAISSCSADGRANLRFVGTSTACRIYNSTASGNATIYHNGASTGCYIYYCTANSNGKIYSNGSVNQRCYYGLASSNGNLISTTNTSTHYQYYCSALSSATVEMRSCAGSRMYSVMASSTSIARLQNSAAAGRLYYSSVTAYYYLLVTLTVTRSALHAHGRRTNTVTDPANGTAVENF